MRNYLATPLAVAALLFCGIGPAHAETLGQIYQQAQQNDHEFKAAQAAYAAGLQNKAIGRSNILPFVAGQASWTQTDGDTNSEAGEGEMESTAWGVTLTQPLFDMSRWYQYEQGKVGANIAEANFYAEKQNLIIRTAEAYFTALRAAENLSSARAEENAFAHQLEQTQKRFEVGLTAITEVHEAQAVYDSAVANRLILEGQLGISFEALEVLTGQPYMVLAPLEKDFPVLPPSPANRNEWVEFAIDNNFLLAVSKLTAESAKYASKQATSGHVPTVTGRLGYSDGSREFTADLPGADPLESSSDGTSSVSVTLDIPIFTGGLTSARRRQAAHEYIQAREIYLQTQRDTVQNARSLHLRVVTAAATVKARRQAITSNQSAVEATQAGYEVGTRDLVDVLNAQRGLFAAQRDYLDALYSYVVDTLRLKQVAGLLTDKDIQDLDAWLDTSRNVRNIP